jgi:hypothetical protein
MGRLGFRGKAFGGWGLGGRPGVAGVSAEGLERLFSS